ncbi:MAG: hypothetical protein ABI831_16235 [Betaproteobacteria bacterium]
MPSTARIDALTRPLRFGPGGRFELRPAEYRLLIDGRPAALGGRALDLLLALAARPSELLTKSELLDLVWPGLVVELWARDDDLTAAAQLSARLAKVIGFTIWRQEVTDWMLSLQPRMQQAPGQALPLQTRATWWSMLAYLLVVRRDPAARPAAKQAVSLWRQLADAAELQAALGHWVRSITEPGAELDKACAELQNSAAAGAVSPRAEQRVQGALAEAARVRGDNHALLACREQELRLAREMGRNDMAQAAETNVCAALIEIGRDAEAAALAAEGRGLDDEAAAALAAGAAE